VDEEVVGGSQGKQDIIGNCLCSNLISYPTLLMASLFLKLFHTTFGPSCASGTSFLRRFPSGSLA
jgi:hypothetical protein